MKVKGQVWKTWDENEQERRRAFCQDVLQHQREVSSARVRSEPYVQSAGLTIRSHPSVADVPHRDHPEQPKDWSDADVHEDGEPARADLSGS